MEVGIVGLPGVGKTALFSALTGIKAEGYSEKAHVGVADIPDPRLDLVAKHIPTRKVVHATLHLVDIPGVPAGSDARKLNSFLEQIRQVEAICHVVRCFDDGSGKIDPSGDITNMETELVLADLVVAEGGAEKSTKLAARGAEDAKARLAVLERAIPMLGDGRSIRASEEWSENERLILKNYGFVTAKPVLCVANVDEDDLEGDSQHAQAVKRYALETGAGFVAVCAKLEAELAELEEPDRSEMVQSLGLKEPAVGSLARAAQTVLGLATFYTTSEKEIHAWTVPLGASAPEAAGAVHSDMQRGFIRAECYHVSDLEQYGTEKAIREAGKLRSEGKHYQMEDGEVVRFLFNV
ncbi:MAG: redox-regulated ATPase YchF [Phycisphaerales bacterium]|nr:MAG: redox-regulated ATPase YchF [Phycisphaerales bacterium]